MIPRPFAYMRDASTKALVERLARIDIEERHVIHLARVAHMATGKQGTPRKWEDIPQEERNDLICHATDAINEARSRA